LSDEQIEAFKKMFDMMDKDKNGSLSFEELKDGLSMIGHAIPDPEVQMLLEAVSDISEQHKHFCYFQYLNQKACMHGNVWEKNSDRIHR